MYPKTTKNPLLEPPWSSLGAILEPLGDQDALKRRSRAAKRRQDRNFRANLTQLGSNLEAQDPPKSMQEGEKVDIKK